MKLIQVLLLAAILQTSSFGQFTGASPARSTTVTQKQKKYPSLLWEITGNGLKKPSYLFGTMHVSSKTVFILDDSFYNAMQRVEVVALEQNPEVWQEEYARQKEMQIGALSIRSDHLAGNNEKLSLNTFAIKNYEDRLKQALRMEARMINGLMYRSVVGMEEFEEDTYLDMYIYRTARRMNKKFTGVEDYKETERLVKEAYKLLDDPRYRKRKSYNYEQEMLASRQTELAYKNGDLDMLDSLQEANVQDEKFRELFMFARSRIQAQSIDSILKTHSLFVAVGAAHLPGQHGVIEFLRAMGYKLRPVTMSKHSSTAKERLDLVRVPNRFVRHSMPDSLFSFSIPSGQMYRYPSYDGFDTWQYIDIANGSYYLISRIRTNASFFGDNVAGVEDKIFCLLYEHIPGKIITRRRITSNGYSGYEVTNKTKKGDIQRYQIFALPDEVVLFKTSGAGDYILKGDEAKNFFSSISFSPRSNKGPSLFADDYSGFRAILPTKPLFIPIKTNASNRHEWISSDAKGNSFMVMKYFNNQVDYIEEDTFMLRLAEESFAYSGCLKARKGSSFTRFHNYPALQANYLHADSSHVQVLFYLCRNSIVAVAAKGRSIVQLQDFFANYSPAPYRYNHLVKLNHNKLGCTITSLPGTDGNDELERAAINELMESFPNEMEARVAVALANYQSTITFSSDTTGQAVIVTKTMLPPYYAAIDSASFINSFLSLQIDGAERCNERHKISNGWFVQECEVRKPGSERVVQLKLMYKDGLVYTLRSVTDAYSAPDSFISTFFSSFEPVLNADPFDPFTPKSQALLSDYFSGCPVARFGALSLLEQVKFDSADLPGVVKAIEDLEWSQKDYMQTKRRWIAVLGGIKTNTAADYLAGLYTRVKDTSDLQNQVLDALTSMKTAYAFNVFRNAVLSDAPGLVEAAAVEPEIDFLPQFFYANKQTQKKDRKWQALYDTIALTAAILPDLAELLYLEDYRPIVLALMAEAADAGMLSKSQVSPLKRRLLLEANQFLKKQLAMEDKLALEQQVAEHFATDEPDAAQPDQRLLNYTRLLLLFEGDADVESFYSRMMTSKDPALLLDLAITLLKRNRPVPHHVFLSLAANANYRLKLHRKLQGMKRLDRFPKQYRTQDYFSKSHILEKKGGAIKIDTLVPLWRQNVVVSGQEGFVYFFKYRKMRDDLDWYVAISGLQPLDTTEVWCSPPQRFDITTVTDEAYNSHTPAEQLNRVLKESIYSRRPSADVFYQARKDDQFSMYSTDGATGGLH